MSDDIPNAVEQRPWQPSDGPKPSVHVYPHRHQPALLIRRGGEWRPGRAIGRQRWADGGYVYQVEVNAGLGASIIRTYRWPQPGVRLMDEPQDDAASADD
jgi:hypothetical protein